MSSIRLGIVGFLSVTAGPVLAEQRPGLEPTLFSPLPEVFFAAPAGLTLQDYGPEWVTIGYPSLENGFMPEMDVHAFQGGPAGGSPDFESFALSAIRNTCAGDGPGETIYCDAVRQRQPFTTDSELEGEILYLDRVHETSEPESRDVAAYGPVFLFDLSGKTNGEEWIALVVQPLPTLDVEAIDDSLLLEVARTVEVWTGSTEE